MTREELEKFLLDSCIPQLEQAYRERDAECEGKKNEHERAERAEAARKKAEDVAAAKDIAIKSKDAAIKAKDEEIERLKKELQVAKDTKATANRNTYGKSI